MPMKSRFLSVFLVVGLLLPGPSGLFAAQLWTSEMDTPTPVQPPDTDTWSKLPANYQTATPTPAVVPNLQIPTATPTPRPGLKAVDPTAAAIFSAVVPGSGQVYAGDPVKGLVLATLFGLGLWQTIDKLSLVPSTTSTVTQQNNQSGNEQFQNQSGTLVTKDETLGSIFGLATLVVYGFEIQDASDTANHYNKVNYLTFNLGLSPEPKVQLAYRF